MAKFGRIKRQHSRVAGLDELLERIIQNCPYVHRIVPGRLGWKKGRTPARLRIQYATHAGLKCIYTRGGSWQEVFMICSDSGAARQWLVEQGLAEE